MERTARTDLCILAGALALLASPPRIAAQATYTNDEYGFKIKVPKDFRSVPINMAEKWVVAKFLYKRPLDPKDAEMWIQMTPEIRVIIFPKVDVQQVVAARQAEQKKFAIKDKDGKTIYVNLLEYLQNPFKSYQEYLRENYKRGGWFVAKEKEIKVGGLPAVEKTIEVDDKMRFGTKATVRAWEIDYGDAIYVVQFEVIADYDYKFESDLRGAVRSFKKIARTEALRPVLTGSRGASEERAAEAMARAKKEKLTPEQRREAREADLQRAIEKAKEAMATGWQTYQHGPFTVFHSTDKDFARRVSKQAVLIWEWMDKTFGYIGDDHSVGSILRICKDHAEAQSYDDTSTRSDYSMTAREIVVWDDKDWGWGDYGSGKLNALIAAQFLLDKNRRLWHGLPPWLDHGLVIYIGSLKMKGNKLVAKPDEWDMDAIRRRMREDKFRPSQEVLKANWEDYNASRGDSADRVQSLAVVNFLFEKGRRTKTYKSVVQDYLALLDKRLRETDEEWEAGLGRTARKEKEEMEKWLADWKKRRNKIYDECFETVFGGWSDKTWAQFDHAWKKIY